MPTKPLNPTQQSAFDLMTKVLTDWGLATLVPDLKKLILKGDLAPDTLSLALSQTKAYKERFVGNEMRSKQGLPVLTPAQYIALEEQYNNIMRAYGLPKGFYDQHSDFTKFIGNDVSPAELEDRVKTYSEQYENADQAAKDVWQRYFGLSQGDAIAHMIDPTRWSNADLHNKALQVGIGTAAQEQGIKVSQQRAQQFQEQGVTLAGAQKAYQDIASAQFTDKSIAQRFRTTFGQEEEENARLLGQAGDIEKLKTLQGSEQGLFAGHGAATESSNAPN